MLHVPPPSSASTAASAAPPARDSAGIPASAPDTAAGEERLTRDEPSRSASRSGTLTIKRRGPDAIDFSLLVVNGFHIGEIEGRAERRGAALRFDQSPDEGHCTLLFTPDGPGFRVEEQGECAHGVGVNFDGAYRPPPPKVQPSFDCRKARSPVEQLICSDEILADLDREMDARYRARKAAASGDPGALLSSQRKWLADLGACAVADSELAIRCLIRRYLARLGALDGDPAASENTPPPLYPTMRAAVEGGTFGTVLEKPRVAGVLRVLLGTRMYTLRDYMGSVSARMDGEYACVRGAPQGLFTILEGLVAVGPTGDIWVAILDIEDIAGIPDGSKPKRLELHGPESKQGEAPPAVFDAWRERFKEVPVTRKSARYEP